MSYVSQTVTYSEDGQRPVLAANMNDGGAYFDEEMGLPELLDKLSAGRMLIASLGVLAVTCALAYSIFTPPSHEVRALVHINTKSWQNDEGTTPGAEMELLQSWSLVGEALKTVPPVDVRLTEAPYWSNVLSILPVPDFLSGGDARKVLSLHKFQVPEEMLGKSFTLVAGERGHYRVYGPSGETVYDGAVKENAFDQGDIVGPRMPVSPPFAIEVSQLDAPVGTKFVLVPQSVPQFTVQMLSKLRVEQKNASSPEMLQVAFAHENPYFARHFLNTLLVAYVRQSYGRKAINVLREKEYLEEKLRHDSVELTEAERKLEAFLQKQKYIDISHEAEYTLKQITDIQAKITEVRIKRQESAEFYTENHPALIVFDQQLDFLRAEARELEARVSKMPEVQRQLLELKREVDNYERMSAANVDRLNQLKIDAASITGYAKIIDGPESKAQLVWPKTPVLVLLAGIGGIIVGMVIVLLRGSLLLAEVTTASNLRQQLGLPVFAAIPTLGQRRNKGRSRVPLQVIKESESVAFRAVKALAASVDFLVQSRNNNVIVVTSESPAQGKSFVALNFAAKSAASKRVLLVDASLEKPDINTAIGLPLSPGLSGAIIGRHDAKDAVRELLPGKLWILSAGSPPPDQDVLLSHPRFGEIMKDLSQDYDLVVVDYPTMQKEGLHPRDLNFAGNVLLVVTQGESLLRIKRFLHSYAARGGEVHGIVLNRVFEFKNTKIGKMFYTWMA